jgi:hypothetical protein
METPRRTIRVPPDREAVIRSYLARTPGATFSGILLDGAIEKISRELAPAAFVLDQLNRFDAVTLRVYPDGDAESVEVVNVTRGPSEIAGRKLAPGLPFERLVTPRARRDRGGLRTIVELAALPGDWTGVTVYVATVPAGANVVLTVGIQDLYPAERPEVAP